MYKLASLALQTMRQKNGPLIGNKWPHPKKKMHRAPANLKQSEKSALCQSQPLCHSFSPFLVSYLSSSTPSSYRTRRWTWNRCIVVWTIFWTRTWPTSRSPVPLSRSLRWTSAACSPTRPLWWWGQSPFGTTHHRVSLWLPFSQGRGDRLLLFPTLTMGGP